MRLRSLVLLVCAAPLLHAAGVEEAAQLLRGGDATAALEALAEASGAEADFWRGRSLLALGRLRQAFEPLNRVPADHPLRPYADRALLYCAWQCPELDLGRVATPMTTSPDREIAALSTAALAEYWLTQPNGRDNTALSLLRERAAEQPELRPLLQLLEIDNLRLSKQFDRATETCREMENNRNLPLMLRQRARLALAEVWYDLETEEEAGSPGASNDDEEELVSTDVADTHRGKGEETLLHFISVNPESPLLTEALRRLCERRAFRRSNEARTKLNEWAQDFSKPKRAAAALLVLSRLLNPEDAPEKPADATCVNTALSALPREAATTTMLEEHISRLLRRGQMREAALYAERLPLAGERSPQQDFLAARLQEEHPELALTTYRSVARRAPERLQRAAVLNAELCALRAGDTQTAEAITHDPALPLRIRQQARALRADYLADRDPAAAAAEIAALLSEQPTPALRQDAELTRAYLRLCHPEALPAPGEDEEVLPPLTDPTEEQLLRYYALQEQWLQQRHPNDTAAVERLLRRAAAKTQDPTLYAILTLHLVHRLSTDARHEDAIRELRTLLQRYPKGAYAARALVLMAHESELLGTREGLERALQLYTRCAEGRGSTAVTAAIRCAAVLSRLGRSEQAISRLRALMLPEGTPGRAPDLDARERTLAAAALANAYAQLGTREALQEAVNAATIMLDYPELSPRWRLFTLLHHALLCTRAGKNDLALGDYLTILGRRPPRGTEPDAKELPYYHQATAGAVAQYLIGKRYAEAAALAEEIALWEQEIHPEEAAHFRSMAEQIRRTHFLPSAR
ncbi:MAG: tol-pal system YbgF family protein [Akkermansia sp.]